MKRLSLHSLVVSSTLLLAVGCSTDDDLQPPIGTWAFDCRALAPGLYFAGTNVTTAEDWEIQLVFAPTEDGCGEPILSFRAHGPHEVLGPADAPPDATAIDFVITNRLLTLHDDSARDVLAYLGCDTSAYALEQEVNLNETGCGSFAASREECSVDYDIFKVEGDTLFIGKRPEQGDICAPERRPTMLDRDWPFVRQ